MKKIGVIGSGVMGIGVAQSFAQAGYQVILVDVSDKILEEAKQKISANLRFHLLFHKGVKNESRDTVLARIEFTTDYQQLKDVDFVVENVTENWTIKKEVYSKIDSICPEHCIFGVNTSAISITKVASVTKRPSKVIGIHFMNPVPIKPVVEIIRGYHTSEETISITKELLASADKKAITVNDSPGFITNRAMMIFVNEAIFTVHEQVATPEEVDELFKTCFGHKMGPLQTADLIGLDTILYSLDVLYESFNDDKYRPCVLLKKMVDAGLHGMKSGQGFYTYEKH